MTVVQVARRFLAVGLGLPVILGGGQAVAEVAGAGQARGIDTAPVDLDIALVGFDREEIDDSFLGAGFQLTARPASRLEASLRMERVEEYDAEILDNVSVERMRMGLAFSDPVTPTMDAVYALEVGYTSASSAARTFGVFGAERSYLEYGAQVGVSAMTHRWRTDLMAVVRANNETEELDNQAGGRLEISGYSADFRYAGFIEGEMLTDDRTVRLGIRRMFY